MRFAYILACLIFWHYMINPLLGNFAQGLFDFVLSLLLG
jgi:hypothetical protein